MGSGGWIRRWTSREQLSQLRHRPSRVRRDRGRRGDRRHRRTGRRCSLPPRTSRPPSAPTPTRPGGCCTHWRPSACSASGATPSSSPSWACPCDPMPPPRWLTGDGAGGPGGLGGLGRLTHSVHTGETAFTALHGKDVWVHRAEHPDRSASFDALMTSLSSLVVEAVASSYDFSGRTRVVDGGVGQGSLLAALLRQQPQLLPERCSTPATCRRNRVATGPGGTLVGGWRVVLRGGAACRLLRDEVDPARLVRRRVRDDPPPVPRMQPLRPDGVVLVVRAPAGAPRARTVHRPDVTSRCWVVAGGRERTEAELRRALFARADYRLTRVVDTGTPYVVLEAVAG